MLIDRKTLDQIVDGTVTLAFRRWKRPTVRSGGRLRTAVGELSIQSVEIIKPDEITDRDAQNAGYESGAVLIQKLNSVREGDVYRISLAFSGTDPRRVLAADDTLDAGQIAELKARLDRFDKRSSKPWTRAFLVGISEHPGMPASELASLLGFEKEELKLKVRRLKELGLTESLQPGYRLSPRGRKSLEKLVQS